MNMLMGHVYFTDEHNWDKQMENTTGMHKVRGSRGQTRMIATNAGSLKAVLLIITSKRKRARALRACAFTRCEVSDHPQRQPRCPFST
eukprot:1157565-Pelagomonas_calceolata.AAC.8